MTSSNRGINNELVIKIKGEVGINNTGAMEAKGLGVFYVISIDVSFGTEQVKCVTIILLKHVNEDVDEKVMIKG